MKTVVIDAGHGGKDTGAIGATGKLEKDFNLTMVLKVRDLLKSKDIKVILTRDTDVFIELTDRAKTANKAKADAFLSIHANALSATSTGTETLYTKDMDVPFAQSIHNSIMGVTGFSDRKCKYQNLSVCRNTKMPATLIEPGFLTNPDEESKLFDQAWQDKLAEALARGICEYLGVDYDAKPAPEASPMVKIDIVVDETKQRYTGYLSNGRSWVPARYILDYLNANWTYKGKQVYVNDTAIETMLVDDSAFVKASDLYALNVTRVFYDPAANNPKQVLIYKPL
ncbi:N-acetylmuramoyl-L-alanine amidase [Paenibacillus sp. HN-1]|uniref:N-acetylmuramoyl-L-alanine amidase family protein n=1 Tax=Paenibacillus TaxID=44249 RepID=UPI001CA84903|nr:MULTISPECIES: N-acetylmuramoyl-L-alanine amidase [Paenibacillus]MBY9081189.1 N-acetylmuramoyl-L-alanine amidase [Paenibacillus sp. CGMCC 1.18879]MBY9087226.1 N-acetylmuramoyl-L-alanine amidase [Paenibacillus sinensis]